MPIDWNQYGEQMKIGVGKHGVLNEEGIIYTEGLGPCVGMCIAYGMWAGMIHSILPEHDEKEYDELIAAAKAVIPAERLSKIRPILCGSDARDAEGGEATCDASRKWAVNKLKSAGFADPITHWCGYGETAELRASLVDKLVEVEVGYNDPFEYPIPQK